MLMVCFFSFFMRYLTNRCTYLFLFCLYNKSKNIMFKMIYAKCNANHDEPGENRETTGEQDQIQVAWKKGLHCISAMFVRNDLKFNFGIR